MDAEQIWESARELLLSYEGMASQIYVLDVPHSQTATVLNLFAQFVENPVLVGLAGIWGEPRPLTPALTTAIASDRSETSTHQLKGSRLGREDVSLYLWPGRAAGGFDVEVVFWADQLFPEPEDTQACFATFEAYHDLVESFRAHAPSSACVLSASEAGDPYEDRDKPWTYCW